VAGQARGDGLGERVTIDGQCAPRRQAVGIGNVHDQRSGGAHFPMQQSDRVLFVIIGPERIGTDHFCQRSGAVGEGFDPGPHFVDRDLRACLGRLPRGLGPGHAAADDVYSVRRAFRHGRR